MTLSSNVIKLYLMCILYLNLIRANWNDRKKRGASFIKKKTWKK